MNEILKGKFVVLGVTGSIAVYKVVELARRLTQAGATVQVVMTPGATQFVQPLTFQALTYRPVEVEMFGTFDDRATGHVATTWRLAHGRSFADGPWRQARGLPSQRGRAVVGGSASRACVASALFSRIRLV